MRVTEAGMHIDFRLLAYSEPSLSNTRKECHEMRALTFSLLKQRFQYRGPLLLCKFVPGDFRGKHHRQSAGSRHSILGQAGRFWAARCSLAAC